MSAAPLEDAQSMVPATDSNTAKPSPNGEQAPAPSAGLQTGPQPSADKPSKLIEEYGKMLDGLRTRLSSLDAQLLTMIYSEFTIVAVSLAFVGFVSTRGDNERIAASALHSFHYQSYVTTLVWGFLAFTIAAALTLIFLVIALLATCTDVNLRQTLPVDVIDSAGYSEILKRRRFVSIDVSMFKQKMLAMSDESKLDKMLTWLYAHERAMDIKILFRSAATVCFGVQVLAFVSAALAALLMLLSGH